MINHLYMSYDTAHQCHVKGCHSVLVLDGNMKNRRDVCKARHAGYVNYEGLQGSLYSIADIYQEL